MKQLKLQIAILDNGTMASLEEVAGFKADSIESQLLIIGMLDNLKQKHLDKLKTLYEASRKK